MGMMRRESAEENAEPQMTPMIDMVFLLLIFFLVTASLKKPTKVLPIQMPQATYGKLAKFDKEVIISLAENGDRYVDDGNKHRNQAPVSREEMLSLFADLSNTASDMPIRLDVDRNVKYVHIMEIFDTLELYGLRNVQLRSHHGNHDEKQ